MNRVRLAKNQGCAYGNVGDDDDDDDDDDDFIHVSSS
jgi:hypothetical protein